MIVHQGALVIVARRTGQIVDVTGHSVRRRERDDGHARRVRVHGEVGQQFLDELQFVVEVGRADTGAFVDEEDQLHLAVDRPSQRLHVAFQHRAEHIHLSNNVRARRRLLGNPPSGGPKLRQPLYDTEEEDEEDFA